jgi:YidC/Oxa1 family membrane protein insertase
MDKNTIIGLTLIFILFIVWQQFVSPSPEEVEAQRKRQDSLARVEQQRLDSLADAQAGDLPVQKDSVIPSVPDSVMQSRLSATFGAFAPSAQGKEELETLENDLMIITFSNKGGRIVGVELKNHFKITEDKNGKDVKSPLRLLDDEKNRFEYFLPMASLAGGGVKTSDLFFETSRSENSVTLRAGAGEGRYFEQTYTLTPGTYVVDYQIRMEGLNGIIPGNTDQIQLNWVNYLDKLEKSTRYERQYSTIHFKPVNEDPDYCSWSSDDEEEIDQPLTWVAHTNQFFNSTLMATDAFSSGKMRVEVLEEDNPDLKKLTSELHIPYNHSSSEQFNMEFYIGPNEFERLMARGDYLEDIVPFGWSIFGTINRWVIRPIFNFLSQFIGSKGIVILALTFIVKLVLFPLTYRMLYSQSKMSVLKPQLESMRNKYKDDQQKQQMEQMKIYREFGVNPLGGCLPMVLQMPIWFALYRFFPASIEFRQEGFLWANDLSSYDAFIHLPYEIPLGFGSHISLFTMLWAVTTLLYTYYNTRHMDMSANPAMKYMQYLMPLFFLGFFNSFASGLTAYLLFSNLFNITQTLVTKNLIIDQEKIKEELEAYRRKPKKKKGFQQRLEEAMREQQRTQAEKENKRKRRK